LEVDQGGDTMLTITYTYIEAANPISPIGHEPFPNGGIVNMGVYGGMVKASESYFGKPLCETVIAGDINADREVNIRDFVFIALHRMQDYGSQLLGGNTDAY
jgi:hypothetical protein